MEKLKAGLFFLLIICFSCKEQESQEVPVLIEGTKTKQKFISQLEAELKEAGYLTMSYVDAKTQDTLIMQQYFMAFLKKGPNRNQTPAEADSLQGLHLAHLSRMYELGYADLSGPFGDDGEIMGITVYNTPTLQIADSLAHLDPMVQAGRLKIEIHPWWAAKGFGLR